jgi:hypothetical protein
MGPIWGPGYDCIILYCIIYKLHIDIYIYIYIYIEREREREIIIDMCIYI